MSRMMASRKPGTRGCRVTVALLVVASGIGCSVTDTHEDKAVYRGEPWVVLPFRNYAEAPKAGERVEALVSTLLRSRGIESVSSYPAPAPTSELPELDERRRFDAAFEWAQTQSFTYAVSGTVTEWRYKAGLDGEPAVGVDIEVFDLTSGKVVWSAAGSRAGWGRESVSGACQTLLNSLLGGLPLRSRK